MAFPRGPEIHVSKPPSSTTTGPPSGQLPDTGAHKKTALHLQTLGQLHTLEAVTQPSPQPAPGPPPPTVIGGAGGSPFLFPIQPGIPGPEILEPPLEDPSPEDLERRAKTLAAALGAAIDDGDDATRLAATLALLFEEIGKSSED